MSATNSSFFLNGYRRRRGWRGHLLAWTPCRSRINRQEWGGGSPLL